MPIVYILGALLLAGVGVKLYNTIQQNGAYEAIISNQERTIANKDKIIDGLKLQDRISQRTIELRNIEIEELTNKYEGITVDLGQDAQDQAPESLKEYFRRLNERL